MKNWNVRTRLAVILSLITLAVYAAFAMLLWVSQSRATWQRVDASLIDVSNQVAGEIDEVGVDYRFGSGGPVEPPAPIDELDVIVAVLDQSGRRIVDPYRDVPLIMIPIDDETLAMARRLSLARPAHVTSVSTAGFELRLASRPWASPSGAHGAVQVAKVVDDQVVALRRLGVSLAIGGAIAVGLVAFATVLVTRIALAPLDRMRVAAETISVTEDPSIRLGDTDRGDEVGRLARAFDLMLHRLNVGRLRTQEALDKQRRFVADASHELRTPLTSIRGNVDLLLRHPDLADAERTAALVDVAKQARRMSRMTDDLLSLARAEATRDNEPVEIVPADVAADAVSALRRRDDLDDRTVALHARSEGSVIGDEESLRRALDAICENAVIHGAGRIDVTVSADEHWLWITVSDEGDGIAQDERTTVFDRLARGRNAAGVRGAGLGLAICRSLVATMRGRVDAVDGGVVITLPLSSDARDDDTTDR